MVAVICHGIKGAPFERLSLGLWCSCPCSVCQKWQSHLFWKALLLLDRRRSSVEDWGSGFLEKC